MPQTPHVRSTWVVPCDSVKKATDGITSPAGRAYRLGPDRLRPGRARTGSLRRRQRRVGVRQVHLDLGGLHRRRAEGVHAPGLGLREGQSGRQDQRPVRQQRQHAAEGADRRARRNVAVTDHSMYLDPAASAYGNLFNSGKIGMLVTGPWDLSSFPNVHYGVQVMPQYPGTGGGHQTIAGPDNWVVFNNGAAHV